MVETPNHEYNLPEKGDRNWHEPLNENFNTLEIDIELRDEDPPGTNGYEPASGAKYLDTKNGIVYIGDDSGWNPAFVLAEYQSEGLSSIARFGVPLNAEEINIVDDGSIDLAGGELIDSSDTDNNAVTLNAGNGLANGGDVPLGGSRTLDVNPADIAGSGLEDDGNSNLTVNAGSGLETNEQSGSLQAVLGNALGFDSSNQIAVTTDDLTVAGNSVSLGESTDIAHSDLTEVSEDQHHSKNHDHTETGISAVPNAGLANSSVTVSAGNGLSSGGQASLGGSTTLDVNPADIAGSGLVDDGNSNLTVDAGSGLETNEQSGSLQAAWGDADDLGQNGTINDFSAAADLNESGNVTGGTPDDFSNASDLSGDGSVDTLSGSITPQGVPLTNIVGDNLSISGGQLNASTSLTGGEGISPDSITDGDELSVAWGDGDGLDSTGTPDDFSAAADLDTDGNLASDAVHDQSHSLGSTDDHESDKLENLNNLISDATLDSEGETRPPEPPTTADVTERVTFGNWQAPESGAGAWVDVEATAETDGTDAGRVRLEIDETGNEVADNSWTVVDVPSNSTDGTRRPGSVGGRWVPDGGNYRIVSESDPNNANSIDSVREVQR